MHRPALGPARRGSPRPKRSVYVINCSQGVKDAPWGQAIRFSTSTDLKAWIPATEIPLFHEEGKHYTKGRWDTIMQFTDADVRVLRS